MDVRTPAHYRLAQSQRDLYALFAEVFGPDYAAAHLLMEAIQYLWRARTKGQYTSDLQKVQVILTRLLEDPAFQFEEV